MGILDMYVRDFVQCSKEFQVISPLSSTDTPYGGNEIGRAKRVSGVNIPKK